MNNVHRGVCAGVALVVAGLFLEHSIRYPDGGWDAVAIWNLRARALFAAPQQPGLVFSPELPAQHPDYPILLPALVAHGWRPVTAFNGLGFYLRGEGLSPTPFGHLASPRTFGGVGAGSTLFWVDPARDISFLEFARRRGVGRSDRTPSRPPDGAVA